MVVVDMDMEVDMVVVDTDMVVAMVVVPSIIVLNSKMILWLRVSEIID